MDDFIKLLIDGLRSFTLFPDSDYNKASRNTNCPFYRKGCIGFSKNVKVCNELKSCITVYDCPFLKHKYWLMWEWKE